ncbi:MAG: hypothetical protein WBF09_05120 [Candidatus Acidiferrum sp.]
MKKGSKSKNNAVSIGVAFRPVTRAKLDLIAAGLDRPVGWVIRDAVSAYLQMPSDNIDMDNFRARFPRRAAALDQAMEDAGGDVDEIYGIEEPVYPSSALASPAIQLVSQSSQPTEPSNQPESPAIRRVSPATNQLEAEAQPDLGDSRPASGLLVG